MKREIHAYENDDGTYRTEIILPALEAKNNGKTVMKLCQETKVEIPRADISITCLEGKSTSELFEITIPE